mmetsp:Transcript_25194/g.86272  ORF Transcript_25194/g.86272 Transcript_25194/m.86272 type:complete len:935 (-) Transcript_25194:176-2980(-)
MQERPSLDEADQQSGELRQEEVYERVQEPGHVWEPVVVEFHPAQHRGSRHQWPPGRHRPDDVERAQYPRPGRLQHVLGPLATHLPQLARRALPHGRGAAPIHAHDVLEGGYAVHVAALELPQVRVHERGARYPRQVRVREQPVRDVLEYEGEHLVGRRHRQRARLRGPHADVRREYAALQRLVHGPELLAHLRVPLGAHGEDVARGRLEEVGDGERAERAARVADDDHHRLPQLPVLHLVAHSGYGEVLAVQAEQLVGGHGLDVEALEGRGHVRSKLLRQPQAHLAPAEQDVDGVGGVEALALALHALPDLAPEVPRGEAVDARGAVPPVLLQAVQHPGYVRDVLRHGVGHGVWERQHERVVLQGHEPVHHAPLGALQALHNERDAERGAEHLLPGEAPVGPRHARPAQVPVQGADLPGEVVQVQAQRRPQRLGVAHPRRHPVAERVPRGNPAAHRQVYAQRGLHRSLLRSPQHEAALGVEGDRYRLPAGRQDQRPRRVQRGRDAQPEGALRALEEEPDGVQQVVVEEGVHGRGHELVEPSLAVEAQAPGVVPVLQAGQRALLERRARRAVVQHPRHLHRAPVLCLGGRERLLERRGALPVLSHGGARVLQALVRQRHEVGVAHGEGPAALAPQDVDQARDACGVDGRGRRRPQGPRQPPHNVPALMRPPADGEELEVTVVADVVLDVPLLRPAEPGQGAAREAGYVVHRQRLPRSPLVRVRAVEGRHAGGGEPGVPREQPHEVPVAPGEALRVVELAPDELGEVRPLAVHHAGARPPQAGPAARIRHHAPALRAAHHGHVHHLLQDVEHGVVDRAAVVPGEVEQQRAEVAAVEPPVARVVPALGTQPQQVGRHGLQRGEHRREERGEGHALAAPRRGQGPGGSHARHPARVPHRRLAPPARTLRRRQVDAPAEQRVPQQPPAALPGTTCCPAD